MHTHGMTTVPLMNHTGDGFVLVLRSGGTSLAAVRFASEFRETAEQLLRSYNDTLSTRMAERGSTPPPLAYGMGLHRGKITSFGYDGVDGRRTAFLGSAVNVASRVEGCTKDHPHPVLCTKPLLDHAMEELGKPASLGFQRYFISLGLHNLRGLERSVELIRCEPGLHLFLHQHGVK